MKLSPLPGDSPSADLVLTSDAEVQGLVMAFDWEAAKLQGIDLVPREALAAADLVVRRVEPGYMVLGVVLDDDGIGGEVIPPGTHVLANARFQCLGNLGEGSRTDLVFRDGLYGTAELGPRLDNLITIGGQTVSREEGLVLVNGTIVCQEIQPGVLRIRDAVASPDTGCAFADILLDTSMPVQGFTIAVAHDPEALDLQEITIEGTVTSASGADFSSAQVLPNGGILDVVLDLVPPFPGNAIPPGNGLTIARYRYCCKKEPPLGGPDIVTPLHFADGVLGDPPVDNVLVISGNKIKPRDLIDGTFTCKASGEEKPQEFRCGSEVDPETGELLPIVGFPGSTATVCFFYRSIPKETPGDTGEDQIQGLSMAVCYDSRYVQCIDGTFDIRGTILESLQAEFVNHNCENSPEDGDAGELVVGILIDAMPPFDGRTLPPTRDLLRFGCVQFAIAPDALCGRCNPVRFCDGADGRGQVEICNLISVNNRSVRPAFFNCEICVAATPIFRRGDCNMSGGGIYSVDLADPAATISFLFHKLSMPFSPSCLDACDSNDDGRVDLVDAVYTLRYLFGSGMPPPSPGPVDPGPDPTQDLLDCKSGSKCDEGK